MMKKALNLLILTMVLGVLWICALGISAVAADTVYVDGTGVTQGAYATLEAAINALPDEGGDIVVCGDTAMSVSNTVTLPSKSGKVTVTSNNGSSLIIGYRLKLGCDMEFDNIKIENASTSEGSIFATGHKLVIGSGVTTDRTNGSSRWPTIYGGDTDTNASYDTHLVIKAGTWRNIFGGNRNNTFTGDTLVELSNVTFGGNLSAKSEGGTFSGTAKLVFDLRGGKTVTGGTFKMVPTSLLVDSDCVAVKSGNTYTQVDASTVPTTVYLDGTGSTSGAYTTLVAAIEALPASGGSVIVCGDTSMPVTGTATLSEKSGKVTVTSNNGSSLIIGYRLKLGCDMEFDNIKIENASTSEGSIFATGHKLVIGSGVTTDRTNGSSRWPTIYGGDTDTNTSYDTHLVIKAGTWRNIFGGNRNNTFTGDTLVELSNVTFGGNLSAKSEGGTFSGTAKLVFDLRGGKTVTGGTFKMAPTEFLTDTGYVGVQEGNTYKQIRSTTDTVVVDGTGQTAGAYTTLEAGIAVLPETGGTVIVVGDTVVGTSSSVAQLASKDGKVTITGENDAKLIIALGVRLGSETEIDNIELVNTSTSEGFISANGNKLTIGENVKTSIDGTERWLTIRGASDQGDVTDYDTHLIIKAGTYRYIYGGGKGNFASGKATVQVSNVTAMRISAECENGTFSGTAELILDLRGNKTVTATEFLQIPTFLTDEGYTAVLDDETYKQILAATGPVYVDGTGETEDSYPTVEAAMSVLPSAGGEVIVCGDTTVGSTDAAVTLPIKNGAIVITGLNGAVLTIAGEVIPSGELVFSDIGLESDIGVITVINGAELEIDDTVTVDGTLTVTVGQNGTAVVDNDGVSVVPASGFDLIVDGNTYTVKIKKIGYISNSTGSDNNNGLSADKPKMYQGKADGKGLVSMLYGGGTAIACGDFGVGSNQTWDYGGRVVVTGAYEGTDYKNVDNETGFFRISDSVKLTIMSDLTFDDILLSAGKNSVFYVSSGVTLTITDSVVWLTDTLTIIVEEGATAIIQSGKCATINGKGTIVVEHCEHSALEYGVDFEPATCMQNGVRYNQCKNCGLYIGELDEDVPVDPNAHKLLWTFEDESATAICAYNCGYSVTQVYRNVTEIYLSSKGTLEGEYTAEDPINDFGLAMAIAAAQGGDVTIYVLDNAVIPNSEVHDTYNVYVEPEHANTITVKGIGGSGVLRFNNDKEAEVMIYALSGPTTFESIEFSPWSSTGRLCIVARHNKLVLGENISSDLYEKGSNGLEIIGGCYETFLSPVGGCEKLNTDVTALSGNYTYIYAGAYSNSTCCVDSYTYNGSSRSGGDVHLTLGDVTARREIRAGNYGGSSVYANMNDVHINIVGTVVAMRYFVFTPSNSSYTAQNVYLNLYGGEVHVGQELGNMNQWDYVWGGAANGESMTQRIANKLYVYADPEGEGAMSVYSTVLAELKVDSRNNGKWVAFIMDENYCAVNGGEHTPKGDAVENVGATCTADGYDKYLCEACGEHYYKKIDKIAHTFGASSVIAATCISPEIQTSTCTVCGMAEHRIIGETYGEHSDPEKTGICRVCNADLTVICNHSFGTPVPFDAGCGTGTKSICALCGKENIEVVGDGHNYGAYSITVAPTATAAGVKTRTCKSCGKVDTAVVYAQNAMDAAALAVDTNGNLANFSVENTKLSKAEKAVLNELLQQTAYGSEVKVSYETDGNIVKNIVYMIPVPKEYADYENIRVIVRDDNGEMHDVHFEIEKGYIVFVF